jgi:hypothetical protein
MVRSVGSYQNSAAKRADIAAAQLVGGIVGPQSVPLDVEAEEYLGFDAAALDAPAGQDLADHLRANDFLAAEASRVVPIEPARQHELEHQPVILEAAWRDQQSAIGEGAVAPEVAAGKQNDGRVLVIASKGGEHADATDDEGRDGGRRRVYAPPATHRGPLRNSTGPAESFEVRCN